MSKILLQIDGIEVKAEEGETILKAAQNAGITIPTICYNEKLESFGGCRICTVEVERKGYIKHVVSCVYPVEDKLIVRTRSEKIDKTRKMLLELLMARAPDSLKLKELAEEYGADKDRFEKEASFCIHCGLCVRYCDEVKQLNAVGFVNRGAQKEISFVTEIASKECWDCKECFPLCPTSALQAAYVLIEGLAFSKSSSDNSPNE